MVKIKKALTAQLESKKNLPPLELTTDPTTWTDEQKQRAKLDGLNEYVKAKKIYREAADGMLFELTGSKIVRWERAKERLNFLFFKISHLLGFKELEEKFLNNAKENCDEEFNLVKFDAEEAYKLINLCKQQDKTPWIAKWKRKLVSKTIAKFVNFCFLSFGVGVSLENLTDEENEEEQDEEDVEQAIKSLKQAYVFLSTNRAMFDDTEYSFTREEDQEEEESKNSSFSDKTAYELMKFLSLIGQENEFKFGLDVSSLVYYGLIFTIYSDVKPCLTIGEDQSIDKDKVINATFSI